MGAVCGVQGFVGPGKHRVIASGDPVKPVPEVAVSGDCTCDRAGRVWGPGGIPREITPITVTAVYILRSCFSEC